MLDKEAFFKKYSVQEYFQKSGLDWKNLEDIYDDYVQYRNTELDRLCVELENFLMENFNVHSSSNGDIPLHSIRGRVKSPEHLVEKIIRKRGKEHSYKYKDIDVSNYKSIVRDLIGIRILVLAKEEWEGIFDEIVSLFPQNDSSDIRMVESPKAYTRYGDRDIFKGKIVSEHSNKGYRSQHYVVCFKGVYCEIQVRTLSEEVFGEFDHKVKYPYRDNNKFLIRYSNTLSQLLDSVDELISTCFQLNDSGWDMCDKYYENDKYIDWKNIDQEQRHSMDRSSVIQCKDNKIDMKQSAINIFIRKE
nr:hypothetical protein [uncultured Agathobacter sp.]